MVKKTPVYVKCTIKISGCASSRNAQLKNIRKNVEEEAVNFTFTASSSTSFFLMDAHSPR